MLMLTLGRAVDCCTKTVVQLDVQYISKHFEYKMEKQEGASFNCGDKKVPLAVSCSDAV